MQTQLENNGLKTLCNMNFCAAKIEYNFKIFIHTCDTALTAAVLSAQIAKIRQI